MRKTITVLTGLIGIIMGVCQLAYSQQYGVKWVQTIPGKTCEGIDYFQGNLYSAQSTMVLITRDLYRPKVTSLVKHNQCLQPESTFSITPLGWLNDFLNDFHAVADDKVILRMYGLGEDCMPDPISECMDFGSNYALRFNLEPNGTTRLDTIFEKYGTGVQNQEIYKPYVYDEHHVVTISHPNERTGLELKVGLTGDSALFSSNLRVNRLFLDGGRLPFGLVSVGRYQDSLIRVTLVCDTFTQDYGYFILGSDSVHIPSDKFIHLLFNRQGQMRTVLQTVKPVGVEISHNHLTTNAIFDRSLNFYSHRYFISNNELDSSLFFCYSPHGNVVWQKRLTNNSFDYLFKRNEEGNILLNTITFSGSNVFALLDSSGNTIWEASVNDTDLDRRWVRNSRFVLTNDNRAFIGGKIVPNLQIMGVHIPQLPEENSGFIVEIGPLEPLNVLSTRQSYCVGDSVQVQLEAAAQALPGNLYVLELSNSQGSFDAPMQVAESEGSQMSFDLPLGLPEGENYRFRVRSTAPAQTGNPSANCFIIHQPPATPVISPADTQFLCLPGRLVLRAQSDSPFAWNTGHLADSLVIDSLQSGSFYVTASRGACRTASNRVEVRVNTQPMIPPFVRDTTFCLNIGTGIFQLPHSSLGGTWTGEGVSSNNFNYQSLGISSGWLTYRLTNGFCTKEDSLFFRILGNDEGPCILVNVSASTIQSRVTVFPNPSQGSVQISFPIAKPTSFYFTDLQGKILNMSHTDFIQMENEWQVRNLPEGTLVIHAKGYRPERIVVLR